VSIQETSRVNSDSFKISRAQRSAKYESLDNEQALDVAVKDLKENHDFYIERFKKWLKNLEEPKRKK
jgi:hypothetical protein